MRREPATILGIDPGSHVLGWGAVRWEGPQALSAVAFGALRVPPDLKGGARLLMIRRGVDAILARIAPDAVALEEVFYGRNFQSALTIGEVRGVCLLAAAEGGFATYGYSAAEVKAAVTGNGRAHKSQVTAMVARILRLTQPPRPADAGDALACALCNANRLTFPAAR